MTINAFDFGFRVFPFRRWRNPWAIAVRIVVILGFTGSLFGSSFAWVTSFGHDTDGIYLTHPTGVVEIGNSIYVADNGIGTIDTFNTSDVSGTFTRLGSSGTGNGQFQLPYDLALDKGLIYVADYANNRIDRFDPQNFLGSFTTFGTAGSGAGQLSKPYGVTVKDGLVYVADGGNKRIVRFDPANFSGSFTSFSLLAKPFVNPTSVAVDDAGLIYVTDTYLNESRVIRFDPTAMYQTFTVFGGAGAGVGQFSSPRDLAVRDGIVYVADTFNYRIAQFDPTNFLGSFTSYGEYGTGVGQLNGPTNLWFDASGNLFIGDATNLRVVELQPVPEPSGLSLCAFALLGLAALRVAI